jgi:hypothetical protein
LEATDCRKYKFSCCYSPLLAGHGDRAFGHSHFAIGSLVLVVLVVVLFGSRAPVDESWPETREAEDRLDVGAIWMHLVEPEAAVILKAENDPAALGGVGANEGVDVAAFMILLFVVLFPQS